MPFFLDWGVLIYGCIAESECFVEGNGFYNYNRKENFITRTLNETFGWIEGIERVFIIYLYPLTYPLLLLALAKNFPFLFYLILAL